MLDTVRSVQSDIPEGAYPSPNEYVTSGWVKYLPFNAIIVLHFTAMGVVDGRNKSETILDIMESMEQMSGGNPLFFDFEAPKPKGKKKLQEYEDDLERESKIKRMLERNGYKYPQSVVDMVELFKQFGIIHEIDRDGVAYLDVLLGPYPEPKSVLDIRREDHVLS